MKTIKLIMFALIFFVIGVLDIKIIPNEEVWNNPILFILYLSLLIIILIFIGLIIELKKGGMGEAEKRS